MALPPGDGAGADSGDDGKSSGPESKIDQESNSDIVVYTEEEEPLARDPVELRPDPSEYSENEAPGDRKVAKTQKGPGLSRLRLVVIVGLGTLLFLGVALGFTLVVIDRSLQDFAKSFLQLIVGGLIGLGGSVVGFLFAGNKGE